MLEIHCFGKHLFFASSFFLATRSYWIFQVTFTFALLFSKSIHTHTIPALVPTLQGKYTRKVLSVLQIKKLRWASEWRNLHYSLTLFPTKSNQTPTPMDFSSFLFFPSYWLSQGPQGLLPGPLHLPTLPHLSCLWHILLSSHPSFHLYGKSLCPVIFEKPKYDMIFTSSSQPHPLKSFWFSTACRIKLKMSTRGPLQSGTVYLPFSSWDREPLEGRVWVLSRLCILSGRCSLHFP